MSGSGLGAEASKRPTGRRQPAGIVTIIAALAVVVGACGSSAADDATRSVARIEAETCTGLHQVEATAVAVGPDLLVTVAHTFDQTRRFDVIDSDGRLLRSELVWVDAERDLALIRTEEPMPAWLRFGIPAEGDVTRLISAADEDGPRSKRAVVLDITSVTLDGVGERQALQLEADIRSGDSGAPVVNQEGQLVGMVFATTRSADRGWAIAAAEIEPVIDSSGEVPPLSCSSNP